MKSSKKIKENGKTFKIIKQTFCDLGESFSERTDKLADICLDKSKEGKKNKFKNVKKEAVSLFKDLASKTKNNLKEIRFKSAICDTSYGMGRISRIVKDTSVEIFNDIIG